MSGTTGKDGNFCFVRFMSLFSVVIIVVLFLPMNFFGDRYSRKYFIAFLAGQLAGRRRICPSNFHLLSVIAIVIGYRMLSMITNCRFHGCFSSLRPEIKHFRIRKKCYFPVKFVVCAIIFVNDCS